MSNLGAKDDEKRDDSAMNANPDSIPNGPQACHSSHGAAKANSSAPAQSRISRIAAVVLVTLFFALLSWRQIAPVKSTTIKEHIEFAERIAAGRELNDDLESLPHWGYFQALILLHRIGFSFSGAALVVLTAGHVAAFWVTYAIYRHFLGDRVSDPLLLGAAFLSLIVAALYVPVFNPSPYYGQGSPNTHHNSTVVLLKPAATLAFFLIIQELCGVGFRFRRILFSGGALLLSVIVKPTFAVVFVPAALPLILYSRADLKRRLLAGVLILAPAVLLLLLQYRSYYQSAGNSREWVFAPWEVWRTQTDSITFSIVAATAFPAVVGAFRFRGSQLRPYLSVAWLMTIAGLLQFALLSERSGGGSLRSANWIGGYLMGLSVLYTFSIAEFLAWFGDVKTAGGRPSWSFLAAYFLLVLHVTSGIVYDVFLLNTGKLPRPLSPTTIF